MVWSRCARLLACGLGLLTLALALALGGGGADAELSESITGLAGRWAGKGTIVPAFGPSEEFKCVITYFPSDDGSRVRQNLRCNGASYHFDAATHLEIAGAQITGRWMDNIYSLTGTVTGAMTKEGFVILLSGEFFNAKMTVISSRCEQSVTVVPERNEQMREMAAVLRKC
jgi:hypothetical protein